MLSIIICSVSPKRLQVLTDSIASTIGVAYELITIDNRERHWPIAKVYNYAAAQAKYPYLLFVHEDVIFLTPGWGKIFERKLAEPDCGVIGFAGSRAKLNTCSGWWTGNDELDCSNYWYVDEAGVRQKARGGFFSDEPFCQVAVIDGFAMFVRKDVWQAVKFDETLLKGFHCYDLDFSIMTALRYRNYVCAASIEVCHLSNGSFENCWIKETIRIHRRKLHTLLPLIIGGERYLTKYIRRATDAVAYKFLTDAIKVRSPYAGWLLLQFCFRPMSRNHFDRLCAAFRLFILRR